MSKTLAALDKSLRSVSFLDRSGIGKSLWEVTPFVRPHPNHCLLVIFVTILRNALGDHTLQEELPDNKEYAMRVRYRLVPGIC